MLSSLTRYLVHYGKVTIPFVGTISLARESAELKFVEKLLMPPRQKFRFNNQDAVHEHQIEYLKLAEQQDAGHVEEALENLGRTIQKKMSEGSFEWHGIGKLSGSMFIAADENLWQPVPAQKVHRQNAEHKVLIGDRHTTRTTTLAEEEEAMAKKKLPVSVIAWIILAIGIAVVLWLLVSGRFTIYSFGLRSSP